LFELNDKQQRLSPHPRDLRKYSLPLSAFPPKLPSPISSTSKDQFGNDAATWNSLIQMNGSKATTNSCSSLPNPIKFKMRVCDELGHETRNFSFDSRTPSMDEFLGFDENFDESFVVATNTTCKKCGH